ncbi:MAG: Asp-tRNA(Asn)/Glu-tRNA(Gln) amidotransferase GatCAB subunit A [Desulfobulbus propionicus]|nr:MAG: Asp-tRNA(Asn)/Glu-tRNA(Gln) amidotransferase GatCAB subunit A [Desulfobulbus propionicus]
MHYYTLTLQEASRKLAQGELTSVALTQSVLDRIADVDGQIKAYIRVYEQQALQQAEHADRMRRQGCTDALCGIPLAVKDVLCTQDMKTTCGSRILEHFLPPYDATVIERLRQSGAVLLGKLTMDEFAMGSTNENCAFGIPENPWKAGYVTGGSSGGSAAAVAADACFAALGSDTGGSIRQPASLCGVVGFKPTYGRVSRYGLIAFASSLDQVGPITKDVGDAAIMMNCIAGYDERDSTSIQIPVPDYTQALEEGLKGLRIGIPEEYFSQGLDPEVEAIVNRGIDTLRDAGGEVIPVSLPHTEYCVAVYYLIAPAEASSNLARFDGVRYGHRNKKAQTLLEMYSTTRSEGFGDEVKRRILIGTYALSAGYYDAYYKKASQVRTLIKRDFEKVFRTCDLIVSPVSPKPAWPIGENTDDPLSLYLSDILTLSANLAGIPGMSVPCGFTEAGLPVGMQLQAGHFGEETLIRAGYNVEKQLGIAGKKPDLEKLR